MRGLDRVDHMPENHLTDPVSWVDWHARLTWRGVGWTRTGWELVEWPEQRLF